VELLLFWHQRTHRDAGYKWVRDALVSNIVRGPKQ
jgi:hypothetical protein